MKNIWLLIPMSWSLSFFCMVDEQKNSVVIPNASYLIYEGASEVEFGIPANSKTVTFYTFDGNPLKTVTHNFQFMEMQTRLDSAAPKPQPTRFKIRYWPAIQIGFWGRKGVPGFFIDFFDKNGNKIKSLRFQNSNTLDDFSKEIDVTQLSQDKVTKEFLEAQKAEKNDLIERNKSSLTRFFEYVRSLFYPQK